MLDLFRLLCDFGLVVLIWMVQLIIYPSFKYYSSENLTTWHKLYTIRVAYVVIPLMFGQLGLAITQVSIDASYLSVLSLVLVLLIWAHTFLFFAPSHGKIAANNITKDFIQKIVRINWWRTFLWTIVFLLSFTQFQL